MLARVLCALTIASSLSVVSGCGAPVEDASLESTESAYNQASSALGRAATLAVASAASPTLLTTKVEDGGIGLTSSAAAAILAHRAGPDGTPGTDDDRSFSTITALEALPSVGKATIDRIRTFALRLTVAHEQPTASEQTMTLEQLLAYGEGQTLETLCSARARYGISYDGGDGSLATWAGVWKATVTLGKSAAAGFTFVEGAGLALNGDLEVVIETESVMGQWHPYGPHELSFPRIPTVTTYTHLEPASAGQRFTTQGSPPAASAVVTHDARFALEVSGGAFAIRGTMATRKGYGPYFSGYGTANYVCRPWE